MIKIPVAIDSNRYLILPITEQVPVTKSRLATATLLTSDGKSVVPYRAVIRQLALRVCVCLCNIS